MKINLRLEGLECANCASKIERAAAKLAGVKEASVNFMTQKMAIECEDAQGSAILQEVERVVKKNEPHVVVKRL